MLTTATYYLLSTDHSPVLILLSNDNSDNNGPSPSKFNSSAVYDEVYVENMKKIITKINTSKINIKSLSEMSKQNLRLITQKHLLK